MYPLYPFPSSSESAVLHRRFVSCSTAGLGEGQEDRGRLAASRELSETVSVSAPLTLSLISEMQRWNLFSRQSEETPGRAARALAGVHCSGQLDLAAGLGCRGRTQPKACVL